MAAAIDAGADDMRDDGDSWEIVSAPDVFQKILEAVKALHIEPGAAEVAMLPQNYVKLEGKPAQQMVRLMEAVEEHDDTKKVWSNADIEEKEIEASLA
jgi:transcriptional/translational regulatory protein YebC/TACO1